MDFDDTTQNKKIIKNDLQLYSINLLKNNPDIKEKRKIGYIKDIFTDNIDFDDLELNPCIAIDYYLAYKEVKQFIHQRYVGRRLYEMAL